MNGVEQRAFDRKLFAAAAILFPLIILVGFAPTYYLKPFFDTPAVRGAVVHLHGILMSLWVLLFIGQVWLVSKKQIRIHQRLGFAGVGLAVPLIVVGFFTAVRAAVFPSPAAPPNIPPLSFLLIPLTDLLMFAILFGAAIYYRKQPANHKRLMLLTAINFVPPAIARIQVPSLVALGPLWFFGLPAILAVIAIIIDTRKTGKLNKVFLTGTLLLIASFIGRLVVMQTPAWNKIAVWLTTWAV